MKQSKLLLRVHALLAFSLPFASSYAQQATLYTPQNPGSSAPVNYVRTLDVQAPVTDASALLNRSLREVKLTTLYLDGLGRPLQTVVRQGSFPSGGSAADLVSPSIYDEFGREAYKFLAFAANGGAAPLENGSFKPDVFDQQSAFYSDANPANPFKGQGEAYFYSKTEFEASPLNRVKTTLAPGVSWAGWNRGIHQEYWVNTEADAVRVWAVQDVPDGFGVVTSIETYHAAGGEATLFKNVTTDEHGKQTIEFTDNEGRVILKKVQLTADSDGGSGSGHAGWLCTYYIYDDLGQLRCVLQPKAVEWLDQNNAWSGLSSNEGLLNELAFRYEYDARGRMAMKKVPGATAVEMVYDKRDRLVMTRDGNLRAKSQWLVTLYDELNRPVATGLYTDGGTRDGHSEAALSSPGLDYPFSYTAQPAANWELLTEIHYDDYAGLPAGFSTALFPYYGSSLDLPPSLYPEPLAPSDAIKGMVAWTRAKVLGENTFLETCNLYDEKGRLIQVQTKNVTGGLDVITTRYSFSGQVLAIHVRHQKGGPNPQEYWVATRNSYDALGRLEGIEKNANGAGWNRVSLLQYNALGQLKARILAPDYSAGGLETLTYDYNIRGWLLGVNRSELAQNDNMQHKFALELGYDKGANTTGRPFASVQYNGNIAGATWKSAGDGIRRKYDFAYDNVNRLLRGDFEQDDAGGLWSNLQMNFSVRLGDGQTPASAYDANGNILAMQHQGWTLADPVKIIDALTYSYRTNPAEEGLRNRLLRVSDGAHTMQDKLGDFNDGPNDDDDYDYDGNGNLRQDKNKGIESIEYNHLNLPEVITFTGKGFIRYVYDAAGTKLKKIVQENGNPAKTTLYLFGTYENDALQFLPMEEGRIRPLKDNSGTLAGFAYDYMLKDHLGNVRMVLTDEQKTDFYPAASMEDVADRGNLNDPSNYVPYFDKTDYQNDPGCRYRIGNISGYPTDNFTSPNDYVSRVIATNRSIGPGKALKVMAGDRVNIRVTSWYRTNGADPSNAPGDYLADLLWSMGERFSVLAGRKVTPTQLAETSGGLYDKGLGRFLNNEDGSAYADRPKAFLNWVLFDEQFKLVEASSGFDQVGQNEELTAHQLTNLLMSRNGYLYVYVSNASQTVPVFFDNLQVTHVHGPILEETHYYPFGLTMAGISSKAAGSLLNRQKFNDGTELSNEEFSDGSGLQLYETPFRGYDPQLGRFWQVDAMSSDYESWSPYVFAFNNPVNLNDPSGLFADSLRAADGEMVADKGAMAGVTVKYSPKNKKDYTWWSAFADVNKRNNYWELFKYLQDQGVNERGLRLFDLAWQNIGYRQRKAEIDEGWREFVEGALVEGGTWLIGGVAFKAVSVGFRMYKLSRAASTMRIFWSSATHNPAVRIAAQNFARLNGGITVNMTIRGRILEFVQPVLSQSQREWAWNKLSASFARNATGEIHVFHDAINGVDAGSTWVKHEYRNLNLKFVNINYHY